MKTNIISIVLVNIVCIGFIAVTIFMQFGTDIEVIKDLDVYPVEQGVSHYSGYNLRLHQSYETYIRRVKIATDEEGIEPVWVDAKYVFGTDSEKEIKNLIEKKESVRVNVFVNPKTGETIGVTTKGATRLSLFYNNNKLLKYGWIIILGVDLFCIGLVIFSEKMKRRDDRFASP